MSYDALEQNEQQLDQLVDEGNSVVGYLYPHSPLEVLLAHGLTPSLLWARGGVASGFESSLQTFACSYSRNIFSQRTSGQLSTYSGILFPGNTCDSLQNVADVWRVRFPEDKVLRLTYPAANKGEIAVEYLAEEIRILSHKLEDEFGHSFSEDMYHESVEFLARFRDQIQFLYSLRVLNPDAFSYSMLSSVVRTYLTSPTSRELSSLTDQVGKTKDTLDDTSFAKTVAIKNALLEMRPEKITFLKDYPSPRIVVTGGMTEPSIISSLFSSMDGVDDSVVVLDLLSFGYKSVFRETPSTEDDPFVGMARSLLSALPEPTQEGLEGRVQFLKGVLENFSVDGVILCEQSFCDPDEFEAPSLEKAASAAGVSTLRLPIDPEISDRGRIEGKIQSFLETLEHS